jgi:hypothetical protein
MTTYADSSELWYLLFGSNPDREDVVRWTNQFFSFSTTYPFIINQTQGGPCGVLAPIQAFLIHQLVFNENCSDITHLKIISADRIQSTLTKVLRFVITRALESAKSPIVWLKLVDVFAREFVIVQSFDAQSMTVLDFLASLIASRSIASVKADMDDPYNSLIERFGHCSQETVNLVLIGRARSNVFDREKPMGDTGLMLKGVPEDTDVLVGYLSELEALRYVTVGWRLKNPKFPIWVIGSPSHYTVLFGFERRIVYVKASDRIRAAVCSHFASLQLDEGLMDTSNLDALAGLLQLEPPNAKEKATLTQAGIVILEEAISWAASYMSARDEFKESESVTSESDQLYFVNNQLADEIYSVGINLKKKPQSCPDASLRAVLSTRWPEASVSFSEFE